MLWPAQEISGLCHKEPTNSAGEEGVSKSRAHEDFLSQRLGRPRALVYVKHYHQTRHPRGSPLPYTHLPRDCQLQQQAL